MRRTFIVLASLALAGPAAAACEYAGEEFSNGASLRINAETGAGVTCVGGRWEADEDVRAPLCIYADKVFTAGSIMAEGSYALRCEAGAWQTWTPVNEDK
ncbi:MAG: hypothetical protein AAF318_10320 [Pseudomonadota bacterium]